MKKFEYTITDPLGIHARPAGMLAKLAKEHEDTNITITKGDNTIKAVQLMKLMGLGVKQGDKITVMADGANEETAISVMEKFFRENL